MPIPDYQTAMLSILRLTADGKEHSLKEAADVVATHFQLSEPERNQLLPSGRQTTLYSRVGWAKTYLQKAGLLDAAGRGRFRITQRGTNVLERNPSAINNKLLEEFPEFSAFTTARHDEGGSTLALIQAVAKAKASSEEEEATPEELLEESHAQLRRRLAEELLDRAKSSSPRFFEALVIDLLVAMGYGGSREDAARVVGKSGDEGIDGIIKEDKLGLDVVYVQAKRWKGSVGRPEVQAFSGSLDGQRARKGVMITTSAFTSEARDFVSKIEKKIVLIDGAELAHLMIDHDVGVTAVSTYVIKRIDLDYFGEEE